MTPRTLRRRYAAAVTIACILLIGGALRGQGVDTPPPHPAQPCDGMTAAAWETCKQNR